MRGIVKKAWSWVLLVVILIVSLCVVAGVLSNLIRHGGERDFWAGVATGWSVLFAWAMFDRFVTRRRAAAGLVDHRSGT